MATAKYKMYIKSCGNASLDMHSPELKENRTLQSVSGRQPRPKRAAHPVGYEYGASIFPCCRQPGPNSL